MAIGIFVTPTYLLTADPTVAPVMTYFAVNNQLGFAIPMLIGTSVGLVSVVIALLLSPDTTGNVFSSHLVVAGD
jgi:MFS transporter, SHS family, lactate transporter